MKSMVVPSKLQAAAKIKADTAAYLAKGGKITYCKTGAYTPSALEIYNPHVEYAGREKSSKYLD